MELISGYVLPCLYAFLACIGFCFLFNIHGIGMFICAGGAGLGWLCYLLVALFPLVPGGGIYYTMEHAVSGEVDLFLSTLLHTLGLAGALAVGALLVASFVRLFQKRREHRS